jgi:hypothetical protein
MDGLNIRFSSISFQNKIGHTQIKSSQGPHFTWILFVCVYKHALNGAMYLRIYHDL